uniref:Putative zn2+-dependent endopeptidase insulinase superfamily n=1 Tax=Corethrella appendiculata TaxID=1370023 RepID=U5EMA1_9DIPT
MTFKHLSSVKVNGVIPVHKYRSDKTGLTVILAEVEGPVVNGYFALATEANDDDGLPHTLEHLVFLGSELYPYKGILDLVANRCLASGTNAWTDIDHTCYTMQTAGSSGFISLLPVYLEHILYPLLTDAGFITEVYHINGEGEDGGIVYCEVQGTENTGESRMHHELMHNLYPNCGYSAKTGGVMHNLRTSTSNKKVRDYHAAFYRPENLHVIITGQIKAEDVFASLEPLEEKIIEKGKRPEYTRPWQTPVEPLTESKNIKIVYASDEEDCGLVYVGWRGPKCTTEHSTLTACAVLLRYLSDTSVSPIQRDFIEIPDPYASSVSYNIAENSISSLYLSFENVPLNKVDGIYEKLEKLLKNIANGGEKIDMRRMYNIIERHILEALSSLEVNPNDDIAFHTIGDVLYGHTDADFESRLNVNQTLTELQTKKEDFWIDLLKKYLVELYYVVIRAVPSIAEKDEYAKKELERLEKQRKDLGVDGLAKKAKELAEAMAKNEIPPPEEMLKKFPIPSIDEIHFHPLEIFKSTESKTPPGINLQSLPVYAEAYNVHTNFVYMSVTLNTETLSSQFRSYLLLLMDLLTESPIKRGDQIIPYEEVVTALESDTIAYEASLGLQTKNRFSLGPYGNTAAIVFQVQPKKYEIGVNWFVELLHNTIFTAERIKVCAAKIINDVAQAKREGYSVVKDLLRGIFYEDDSNVLLSSMLKQFKFLTNVLEQMETANGEEKILKDLNYVRDILTEPKNIAIHVAANWEELEKLGFDLTAPWTKLVNDGELSNETVNTLTVIPDYKLINFEKNSRNSGIVVGMGCIESAFLYQASKAINDFNDPDLPALLLFLQYLTQVEGPMWRQIRGQGLSYSYSMMPRPNEGILYFSLYRSTNIIAAYKEAKLITEAQLTPNAKWDENLLESAKSSLIFEIIAREKTVGDLVIQGLLASFKNVPADYNRKLVKQVSLVTETDLKRVGDKYVRSLFAAAEAKTAIVCHPDKANDVATAFKKLGHNLNVQISLEDNSISC